ncbi:MAG TPA: hypothetical protein PLD20_13915 [Blastocatellia bacterium]|nr:hypothetical protein [Blastocatellia bacterium]HMY70882.1 hypothetical protein [Blastocatellia bacterium]HMZ19027.1 hypothetical protein [Blastocatellia bacterium]
MPDFYLLDDAVIAKGYIVEITESAGEEGDSTFTAEYQFKLPDGRELTNRTDKFDEEIIEQKMPYPIEIEYYKANPEINRINGTGSRTFTEWLWRSLGGGVVLLALCLSPSIWLFRCGWQDMRQKREIKSRKLRKAQKKAAKRLVKGAAEAAQLTSIQQEASQMADTPTNIQIPDREQFPPGILGDSMYRMSADRVRKLLAREAKRAAKATKPTQQVTQADADETTSNNFKTR